MACARARPFCMMPIARGTRAAKRAPPVLRNALCQERSSDVSTQSPLVIVKTQNNSRLESAVDVIKSMETWAERAIEPMLQPSTSAWQPQDFLPDPSSSDFRDQLQEFRASASNLPHDFLVVLVGDMITEEALPSYMSMLNRMSGIRDESGADNTSWARWNRAWTAEENRHGDLLNKYLYLTGKVDMRSIEVTIQNLIGSGFDPQMSVNPLNCFVYTSFQERATKISHNNTAVHARTYGEQNLAHICSVIGGDEARHESAYQKIMEEVFRRDPESAMLAFADMMRTSIVMPAHLMNDGSEEGVLASSGAGGQPARSMLFNSFASIAERLGVYTANDYASIVAWLVKRWRISKIEGLSGEAAAAQEFLCNHPERMRRMADIHLERKERLAKRGKSRSFEFSWIHGQPIMV